MTARMDQPVVMTALVLAALAVAILVYRRGGARERAAIRAMFAGRAPQAVLARLLLKPKLLPPVERRPFTYLVCRIADYAKLAETFAAEPERLRHITRIAMRPLAQAVRERGGTIDRMIPGTISAFFNAPLDEPEHAVRACECALDMTEALETIRRTIEREQKTGSTPLGPLGLGIGIASGTGVAGDFGLDTRPDYTVAGTAVTLASAIESFAARYGYAILAAAPARDAAGHHLAFLEIDHLALNETAEPMSLFALLGGTSMRASPKFRALASFHEHLFQAYRARQWERARVLIAQCRALSGASQRLYDLYAARVAYFEANPPPPDWNGTVQQAVT